MQAPLHCDVFCKIVDNYGDIGVCWRLSQLLAKQHGLTVRLFIDDFNTACHIIPGLSAQSSTQRIDHITVSPWPETVSTLPDIVIENFSCGLPEGYAGQIAQQQSTDQPMHCFNLEYLSAEAWVADYHLMPSTHPQLGYQKTFYYPGFSQQAGGLLREDDLSARQQSWQTPAAATAFWQALGLSTQATQDCLKLSLFCYPQADYLGLITALQQHKQNITLLVPVRPTSDSAKQLDQQFDFDTHGQCQLGQLTIQKLPFLSQTQYDQLLYLCDLNFVRGEDSWVRAIWSGKPFIWQPYMQAEALHIKKLNAFLTEYLAQTNAETALQTDIKAAHLQWSNATIACDWSALLAQLGHWKVASQHASDYYQSINSLTHQLMENIQK